MSNCFSCCARKRLSNVWLQFVTNRQGLCSKIFVLLSWILWKCLRMLIFDCDTINIDRTLISQHMFNRKMLEEVTLLLCCMCIQLHFYILASPQCCCCFTCFHFIWYKQSLHTVNFRTYVMHYSEVVLEGLAKSCYVGTVVIFISPDGVKMCCFDLRLLILQTFYFKRWLFFYRYALWSRVWPVAFT